MSKARPQRFYEKVDTATTEDGFIIRLDGRTLKTPGKLTLITARLVTAEMIAAEWRAQGDHIRPETMPVTRLVNVALELTPANRPKLIQDARRYAGTDLLCYRAQPSALARRQAEHWDPVLDWARSLGVDLKTQASVIAITQSPDSLEKVADYSRGLNDLELTLFVHLTAVFGSAVLALAVFEKHITGPQAYDLSRLDARWQIAQWGEDEDDKARTEAIAQEVSALCALIEA